MKRPLYYLLCAIACTSMVGATMPMAAIAEAIQPQETAEQQTQADAATNSDTGKAEDNTNTIAAADTAEDSTATSTGTSQTDPADANATDTATPGTPAPSLRAQTNGTPEAISVATETGYAHSATATQNGVTFTVSWNDAPAGTATTFHVTQANGSSQAKARMDVPTYWDGGSHESVCDPSRQTWASYHSLGTAGHDFTFDFTASGTYRIYFYFMDNDRNDPQNDKGIYYLRTTAEVTVNDAARPSVTQIVNNAVNLCRQETNGSEYDMALWLHDWTLEQLEYDHSLNWCSAESGLTRHQGTCESYQRIYSKLLDAAGIANGRITGNGHTWNAVKIDGKWCQMDLTWDDTSDNWYGDLDQRHLYFGLTDELMAIAHSDHTANYQRDDYAYRSTDLSNNYFVRNGKADKWAEKYADRIQQQLDTREERFSIDADNQSFPPSISGIQNGIVAYAMNQIDRKTAGNKDYLSAESKVEMMSSSS
ncbi:transglutaminase domain-containing protein [Collinsella sp. CLA-AA-H167]|uniref:transglutaminase domain-containing protein n=1 Tax=Collinsella sp. CLA-AA-H167 TaxID=3136223 RepID=UPI0032BF25EC